MSQKYSKSLMAIFLAICFIFFAGYGYSASVHTVISEAPIGVVDGDIGMPFPHPPDPVKGFVTMTWKDDEPDAFFYAEVKIGLKDEAVRYTFECAAPSATGPDFIHGLWNVTRNGKPVCTGCVGRAYGLDAGPNAPVGNYFKLYIGDPFSYGEKWHLGAFITSRFDF
ncbi:MAG: hypothetical protein ACMUIU_02755 [bacterium]